MGRRRQDAYGRRARREGFPARSVYKLEEIDRRVRMFRRGERVLDLGAAPGSWTLYAADKVGREGSVLALDLNPHGLDDLGATMPKNVDFRVADATTQTPETLGGMFDVVISDMAPRTSGQRHRDQFLSFELYCSAVATAEKVLKPGGMFTGKIFQGAEFDEAREFTRKVFEKVRVIRPKAVRDESYEVFLVGIGKRAPASEEPSE